MPAYIPLGPSIRSFRSFRSFDPFAGAIQVDHTSTVNATYSQFLNNSASAVSITLPGTNRGYCLK